MFSERRKINMNNERKKNKLKLEDEKTAYIY